MKKIKFLSAVLALVLIVTMFAGCGPKTINGVELNEDVKKLDGFLCSAEPLTLTLHLLYNGKIWDTSKPVSRVSSKDTNITLDCITSPSQTDGDQAFNLMLTSDVLPDIIWGNSKNTNKAGMEGAMIPLEDLIKEYCPDIQAYFDEHPEHLKGSLAADGHLYYIPCIYKEGPAMGWFIRQDWLDKLGLQAPKTKDEYYNVLKAFREQDPNGNGKKDEVPYFDRHKSAKNLYYLFGVDWKTWYGLDEEKGEMYSVCTSDEYKTAMKELAQWYKEGLIDQEIFTRGGNAREELFVPNLGGAVVDWFSSSFAFNPRLADTGFKLTAIDPPMNVKGEIKNSSPRTTLNGNGWGISKDNKYIAETLKYFNYYFTERGTITLYYGEEGVNYNMIDGEPQFTEEALSYPDGIPAYMGDVIGSFEVGTPVRLEAEVKGMSEDAAKYFQMYIDKDYTTKEFPKLEYTVEENRILSEKGTAIDTYVSEKMQGWILGNFDVDATWDGYVSDLKSLGIDEVLQVYQDAYDRYKSL